MTNLLAMENKASLLIIEDEEAIRRGLTNLFVYHGYEVTSTGDGQEGLDLALKRSYGLVIIDVMLPNVDGYTICDSIRQKDREQPIIMLTAKNSEEDILTGLRLGADDYVTKPFSVEELLLRTQAVLRRARIHDQGELEFPVGRGIFIQFSNLMGEYRANNSDSKNTPSPKTTIEFTRREVAILYYLYKHRERPVSRDELLVEVWGYQNPMQIETRTVDIHIAKIRKKIEANPKKPQTLITVRGEGYQLKLCGTSNDAI